MALTGGFIPDSHAWWTIPTALSRGEGGFVVRNETPPLLSPSESRSDFALWATQGGRVFAGDVDGDGLSDLLLAGGRTPWGSPWDTIPVAFSTGSGRFDAVTNRSSPYFASLAVNASAQIVVGDFDGDGRWELALADATHVLIGSARGRSGEFDVVDRPNESLRQRIVAGGRLFGGDFDGDGRTDLLVLGGGQGILLAPSHGDGTFGATAIALPAAWPAPHESDLKLELLRGDRAGRNIS